MKTIVTLLSEKVTAAFEECGYLREFGMVTISDRPDLCQFQCNGAFTAAKQFKKPPFVIASQVTDILLKDDIFHDVTVAGAGFINISIRDEGSLPLNS